MPFSIALVSMLSFCQTPLVHTDNGPVLLLEGDLLSSIADTLSVVDGDGTVG